MRSRSSWMTGRLSVGAALWLTRCTLAKRPMIETHFTVIEEKVSLQSLLWIESIKRSTFKWFRISVWTRAFRIKRHTRIHQTRSWRSSIERHTHFRSLDLQFNKLSLLELAHWKRQSRNGSSSSSWSDIVVGDRERLIECAFWWQKLTIISKINNSF